MTFENNELYDAGNYDAALYSGVQGLGMKLIHRRLEHGVDEHSKFPLTVEVGAGEGQHFQYVRHQLDRYVMIDLRDTPPRREDSRIERKVGDVHNLPFANESVDRLLATCVLHHLERPEDALNEWRRVVRRGGLLSLTVATDPGFAQRAVRRLTTARAAKKLGIDYELAIAREHRNHASSLMVLVERTFKNDDVKFLGLPFPWRTWNLNLSINYVIRRN